MHKLLWKTFRTEIVIVLETGIGIDYCQETEILCQFYNINIYLFAKFLKECSKISGINKHKHK